MENTSTYSASAGDWPWMNTSLPPDGRAALLLAQMTLEEKVSMLHEEGGGKMSVSRLGIPALILADGPAGIRIDSEGVNGGKVTSPPAPIALAASWNLTTAQQYGDLVGLEAWATGHNVLLGPNLDITRISAFGRLFESFGEDPVSPADLLPGLPLVPSSVMTPADAGSILHGLQAEYWTNTRFEGKPHLVRTDQQVGLNLGFFNIDGMNASSLPPTPEDLNNAMSVRWTGSITVPVTGNYTLSLTHLGTGRLFLDGQLLIEDAGTTLEAQSVTLSLVAGQPHVLRIEYAADRPEQNTPDPGSSVVLIGAKVRFGWEHPAHAVPLAIQEAAALAERSDVAIVVVRDYRNEHADLPSLTLPNEQDLLVQTVVAANPCTIVVVVSGGPVLMPWLDQVPAVLESWYGGQELGNALADVLFGDVNPSGKLPVTFPRSDRDTPVSSPEQYSRTDLVAHFSEGLAVGYRGYDQCGIEPLFPFGYGLSYTSFAYARLQVEPETTDGTKPIQVSCTVTNSGTRAGAEVAQIYLGLPVSTSEPPKRLVGWAKVEVEPGEAREVTVTLDSYATSRPLSYWNVNTNGWEIASGDYLVYVGASSRDIRLTGSLRVQPAEKQ